MLKKLLLFLPVLASAYLDAYTGMLPSYAVSNEYSVTLTQNGHTIQPMVYITRSPDDDLNRIHMSHGKGIFCQLHGGYFCNRTMSWIEFGQDTSDYTTITITRINNVFKKDVRILPISYGLSATLSASCEQVTVVVSGVRKHFALQFGNAPDGSFRHEFFVFVGDRDPDVVVTASNVLYYGPGVHHIEGNGILQMPVGVDTIFIARGAWVEGRINITRYSSDTGVNRMVKVLGHGIMEGSRFVYHGGSVPDSLRFIEVQIDRPLIYDGPTLVHPQGHALFAPPNSYIRSFRMLGWLFNEDGIWIGDNTTLIDSFIRTNDDTIRFYAGALDNFHNQPPPFPTISRDIRVERCVLFQSFNGAIIQIGWEDLGIANSTVENCDVIGAEWYWSGGNITQRSNDAVFSLQGPRYDINMTEHHSNITISNIRIDESVGRVVGLGFYGTPRSNVRNFQLTNITSRKSLHWFPTNQSMPAPGNNFLCAQGENSITGIRFENVRVLEKHVKKNEDWGMRVFGNVTNVVYS